MEERRYHALIRRKGEGNLYQWAVKIADADGAFVETGEITLPDETTAVNEAYKAIAEKVPFGKITIMQFDMRKDSERQ